LPAIGNHRVLYQLTSKPPVIPDGQCRWRCGRGSQADHWV